MIFRRNRLARPEPMEPRILPSGYSTLPDLAAPHPEPWFYQHRAVENYPQNAGWSTPVVINYDGFQPSSPNFNGWVVTQETTWLVPQPFASESGIAPAFQEADSSQPSPPPSTPPSPSNAVSIYFDRISHDYNSPPPEIDPNRINVAATNHFGIDFNAVKVSTNADSSAGFAQANGNALISSLGSSTAGFLRSSATADPNNYQGIRLDNLHSAVLPAESESSEPAKIDAAKQSSVAESFTLPGTNANHPLPDVDLPRSQPELGTFAFDFGKLQDSARKLVELLTEPGSEMDGGFDWSNRLWLASLLLGGVGVAGAVRQDHLRRKDEEPILKLESPPVRG